MLFNSIEFFLFFLVVCGLYYLLSHKWQNRLLILASCLLYASWNWKFLFLMFASISVDFWCSRYIDATDDRSKRRRLLFFSIFVNLSILGFFKYYNFFIGNAQELLKALHIVDPSLNWALNIVLPLGISFYTFEAISYVVDVYQRKVKPAQKYWDYVLFVIFFPHLIAGPIMRAKDFITQITSARQWRPDQFYQGCHLFFWGLFEKIFIADNLAAIVNPVFGANPPYEGGRVLLALYAFAFQIFCDFDGYSNMARGLGKCMGFELTINFKLPYFSVNPQEFWQRWHISLSSWLRDYIYIPLGGNRKGQGRMYLNLLLTMLLGGLWHGASWTFVLWGAYHGLVLMVHRLYLSFNGFGSCSASKMAVPRFIKNLLFFHVVVFGWLLFRAQSVDQAVQMVQAVFGNFRLGGQDFSIWGQFVFFTALLSFVQNGQWRKGDDMYLYRMAWVPKLFMYALMVYLMIGWAAMTPVEFLYFQF